MPFAFRAYAVYAVESEFTDKSLHAIIDSLDPSLRAIETFDGNLRIKQRFPRARATTYI